MSEPTPLNRPEMSQEHASSVFLPGKKPLINFAEAVDEALRNPGRYKSPIPLKTKIKLEMQKKIVELLGDEYGGQLISDPTYPIPLNWQAIFEYLYSQRVITSPRVVFERINHDEPKIWNVRVYSTLAQTDGFAHIGTGYSRGVSTDFEEALSKLVGEFLERYSLTVYRRADLLRASIHTLREKGMNFLNPYNLAGFADWQKEKVAHRQFDDSSNFFWIETKELISNTRAIVPSQLVYWNYNTSLEPYEPFLRQPISNGAAGHFTSTEAILSGIYENIQRDSFLIHWLNAIPPRRINQSSFISPKLKKLVADFERSGFEVIFLNTTLDIPVPSCVSVIIDKSGKGPRMGLGGGCAPDMEEALIRSLTEAMSVYDWLRPQKTFPEIDKNYVPFHDPRIGQAERLLLWGRDDMFQYMQQFLSGPMQNLADAQAVFPNSFSTSQEELEHMIDIFQKKGEGYELYVYEAKHKLLETLGYTVVRVVIPALVPLYLQENHAILGASRLKTAPIACGYTPAEKWNPLPHPFP